MLNFTLTITAAPELLAALSNFTNSIHNAKVVTIPETNQDIITVKAHPVQIPVYNQQAAAPVNPVKLPQQTAIQIPDIQASAVPTAARCYTFDELALAATQLSDAGKRTELLGLLQTFKIQALVDLPKEKYGAFATQLRALGAKI